MRVIVCGGRKFDDALVVFSTLGALHAFRPFTELIEGGARGADCLANVWAAFNGVKITTVRAEWWKHGKRAGMLRNIKMADMRPDFVVAFPGDSGTKGMVLQARMRGIQVTEVLVRDTRSGQIGEDNGDAAVGIRRREIGSGEPRQSNAERERADVDAIHQE